MSKTSSRKRSKPSYFEDYILDESSIEIEDETNSDEESWEKNLDISDIEYVDDSSYEVGILNSN